MSKTAPRRSRIAKVLDFFRTGDKDEIKAVVLILAKEGIAFDGWTSMQEKTKRRRRRLNGGEPSVPETNLSREASA